MTNSLTIAAQNANPQSASQTQPCNFCGKQGLLILPVRCATLPAEAGAPALPGNVGAHAKDISIRKSTYTLRMVRVGYLYMLVNRNDALSWQCYMSTPEGYWFEFAADSPPLGVPTFSCDPATHGRNASMISIFEAENVKAAYLLFTPSPLTYEMLSQNQLKSVKKAEELCSKGQMVKFNPSEWLKGNHKQPHCLTPDETKAAVSEFVLYDKSESTRLSPLGKSLLHTTFPLMATGHEDNPSASGLQSLIRVGPLYNYMHQYKTATVAVYDHIGVAQELNDFRNDALGKVNEYLDKKDKDGISNRWKFDSLQAIREIKKGYETGLIRNEMESFRLKKKHLHARFEPRFDDDDDEMRQFKMGWNNYAHDYDRNTWQKRYPDRARELETRLAKLRAEEQQEAASGMGSAKEEARKRWQKKYAPKLDDQAMQDFDDNFGKATKASTELAESRVDDHLAWVMHDRFVDAFDFYDRNHLCSGIHFEAQSALCTMGMTGIEKSAEKVNAWLDAPVTDRKNIYMRGLLLNQDAIIKEASTALASAAAIAAEAELSVAPAIGDRMNNALKGLIKFYSAADKAWDEYVREFARSGNERNKGLEKTWEGAKLFKWSETNRAIFRRGIGNFEKRLVGYIGGLLFSRLGGLAGELRFEQVVYGINPEKPHLDPKTGKPWAPGKEPVKQPASSVPESVAAPARDAGKVSAEEAEQARKKMMTVAQYRDMQRRAGITFTAEEYMNRKSHMTSNYHQVRIGGLLASLETISLGLKLYKMYKSDQRTNLEYWEAGASMLAVSGMTCDIAYGMAKAARETATDPAARAAWDIRRGGWKLASGAFSTVAGIITLCLDYGRYEDEKDGANRKEVKYLLIAKMAVGGWNTLWGAVAAFSYSGPLLRRAASNLALEAVERRAALTAVAEVAERYAARILILRFVAWGTGAGLLLTAAQIGYEIYIWYQPNALEIWMERSVFRNRSLNGNAFTSQEKELDELANARKLVGI